MFKGAVCAAVAALVLAVAGTASAATTAVLTPTVAPPTGSVTISGSGYDPSTALIVFFDMTAQAVATSNAAGDVSLTFELPAGTQPGTHWVTLDDRRSHAAAQAALTVQVDWPQTGFGPSKRSFNPFENTINAGNVNQLTRAWSQPLDFDEGAKPPIVYRGNIYVRDSLDVVHAFTPTGKLLWTGSMPSESSADTLTPAAGQGKVFFPDLNGDVVAFDALCRTDGGTCTPAWTTTLPGAVAGGITFYNGKLAVPDADGDVHVLDPASGTEGTPIYGSGSSDPFTTWIAFTADGGGYVASGNIMTRTPTDTGSATGTSTTRGLSSPAVGADTAYFTTSSSDGSYLQESELSWSTQTSSSGCALTPPAYAAGAVFATGCTSLGAYDAGTGAALWTDTLASDSSGGLSVANGVLYACIGSRVTAYDASSGARLWTGGHCSAAPVVVNGVLYSTYSDLSAYTLTGAQATARHRSVRRPDARRLMRSWLAHHRHATRHHRRH